MKILFASSSSGSRGGGELFLVYLGRALAQRGHHVTLWASDHERMDELANTFSGFGEVIRDSYANTYDLKGRSFSSHWSFPAAWKIARHWKRLHPDVIHVNKQNLEDGLDLLRAARLAKIPSLATIHLTQTARFLGAKFAGLRDWVAHQALSAYQGMLVAVLENRWKDLHNFLGLSPRVRLVPNGVPLFDLAQREHARPARRQELGFTDAHTIFMGVGRMMPQKRPMLFLEHAERIYRKLTHARFVWVGDGPLSVDWDAWVKAHGLEGIIQRLPWQHDVQSLLFGADVFMHTAHYEGLPLALLEAMSASLPLALTPNMADEMPFLIGTKPIPLDDSELDAATLENREELLDRGALGRRLIRDQFSFERMAEGYEVLYKTLAGSAAHKK